MWIQKDCFGPHIYSICSLTASPSPTLHSLWHTTTYYLSSVWARSSSQKEPIHHLSTNSTHHSSWHLLNAQYILSSQLNKQATGICKQTTFPYSPGSITYGLSVYSLQDIKTYITVYRTQNLVAASPVPSQITMTVRPLSAQSHRAALCPSFHPMLPTCSQLITDQHIKFPLFSHAELPQPPQATSFYVLLVVTGATSSRLGLVPHPNRVPCGQGVVTNHQLTAQGTSTSSISCVQSLTSFEEPLLEKNLPNTNPKAENRKPYTSPDSKRSCSVTIYLSSLHSRTPEKMAG